MEIRHADVVLAGHDECLGLSQRLADIGAGIEPGNPSRGAVGKSGEIRSDLHTGIRKGGVRVTPDAALCGEEESTAVASRGRGRL